MQWKRKGLVRTNRKRINQKMKEQSETQPAVVSVDSKVSLINFSPYAPTFTLM